MRNTKRPSPGDIEAMAKIQISGFVCIEADGNAWLSTKDEISKERIQRLIKLGLIKPRGDGLFPDSPSQTYVPCEENDVQTAC
jgi:hypothetical protein